MLPYPLLQLRIGQIVRLHVIFYILPVGHRTQSRDFLELGQELREIQLHQGPSAVRASFRIGEPAHRNSVKLYQLVVHTTTHPWTSVCVTMCATLSHSEALTSPGMGTS